DHDGGRVDRSGEERGAEDGRRDGESAQIGRGGAVELGGRWDIHHAEPPGRLDGDGSEQDGAECCRTEHHRVDSRRKLLQLAAASKWERSWSITPMMMSSIECFGSQPISL